MLIQTHDKSFTLHHNIYNESYHSIADGALRESFHKHILPALHYHKSTKELKILDICFGLGYNTLGTIFYLQKTGLKPLQIIAPEKDQALFGKLESLAYPAIFDASILKALLYQHYYQELKCDKAKPNKQGPKIEIELFLGDARECIKALSGINIIYQDAFSPTKNKELWDYAYFKSLYAISTPNAIITTYSQNAKMLYGASLAGFYAFRLKQKKTRDSVILLKNPNPPRLELNHIQAIKPINMKQKNPNQELL